MLYKYFIKSNDDKNLWWTTFWLNSFGRFDEKYGGNNEKYGSKGILNNLKLVMKQRENITYKADNSQET